MPGAEIRFHREQRNDIQRYALGSAFGEMRFRLKTITVSMAGQLVRAYALSYVSSGSTGAGLLSSVTSFGRDAKVDANGTVIAGPTPPGPKTTFISPSMGADPGRWTNAGVLPIAGTEWPAVDSRYAPQFNGLTVDNPAFFYELEDRYAPYGHLVGDWNGDGRSEWLVWGITTRRCDAIQIHSVLAIKSRHSHVIKSPLVRYAENTEALRCAVAAWTADVDGDERDDVLLEVEGKLYAARSVGDGTFEKLPAVTAGGCVQVTQRTPVMRATVKSAIADINGDGFSDLVCAQGTTSRTLVTRRGLGNGEFDVSREVLGSHVATADAYHVSAGDVDADGDSDVVIAYKGQGAALWSLTTGVSARDGRYVWESQPTQWPADDRPVQFLTGDFNGDGKDDVLLDRIFPGAGPDDLHIGVSTKGASRDRFVFVESGVNWARCVSVGDWNGDGAADLMLGGNRVALATGQGGFDPTGGQVNRDCTTSAIADVNGDGRADFLSVADDRSGTFTLHDTLAPVSVADMHRVLVGDVRGDGTAAFVYVLHRNPGYDVYTYVPGGSAVRWAFVPSAATPGLDDPDAGRWQLMDVGGTGSAAADGKADLVYVDNDGETLLVYTLLSRGDGTWTPVLDRPWRNAGGVTAPYGSADLHNWMAADIDRDGRSDLAHFVSLRPGIRLDTCSRAVTARGRAAIVTTSRPVRRRSPPPMPSAGRCSI